MSDTQKKRRGTPCATREDIEKFILEMVPGRYEVVEYRPGSTAKVVFRDVQRNVVFEKKINVFKTEIRQNPARIFHPNKEEKRTLIVAAFKEKYGVEVASPFALKEIRDKAKAKIQEIYGVDNVFKNDQIKEQIKSTNIERYGVENVLMRPEIHERAVKLAHSESANEKRIETFKREHGGTNSFTSPDIKKKIDDIKTEKYGSPYAVNDEILEKRRKTMVERYGVEYAAQNKEISEKMVKKQLETKKGRGLLYVYKNKSLTEWAKEKNVSYELVKKVMYEGGIEGIENIELGKTNIEWKIEEFLTANNKKFVFNRQLDGCRFRPDFLIEEDKLIIEANGLFWHCDKVLEKRSYHKNKKDAYTNLGYKSLFFYEDEILKDFGLVSSILLNKMKKCTTIGARKLKFKHITKEESDTFLNENHLMKQSPLGADKIGFALVGETGIVALMHFRKISEERKEIEISRFCTKAGTSVAGAYSKLLKEGVKHYQPKTIFNFIDRRYGEGSYLESFGFRKVNEDISFHWTDGYERFHRMNFPNNTGYENDLAKIWDCGQAKWQLDLNK